jgi:hypothetical protein
MLNSKFVKLASLLISLCCSSAIQARPLDACHSIKGPWLGNMSISVLGNFCQWKVDAAISNIENTIQFNLHFSDPRGTNEGCYKTMEDFTGVGTCINGHIEMDNFYSFKGSIDDNKINLVNSTYGNLWLIKQDMQMVS